MPCRFCIEWTASRSTKDRTPPRLFTYSRGKELWTYALAKVKGRQGGNARSAPEEHLPCKKQYPGQARHVGSELVGRMRGTYCKGG